jgi:hypothetical protein
VGDKNTTNQPNNDRSDVINPNNPKHQGALDEHSRRSNPRDPVNPPGKTQPSNPPGKGK